MKTQDSNVLKFTYSEVTIYGNINDKVLKLKYKESPFFLIRISIFSIMTLAVALLGFYTGQWAIGWLLMIGFGYSLYSVALVVFQYIYYSFKIERNGEFLSLKKMLGYSAVIPVSNSKFIITESTRTSSFGTGASQIVTFQISVRNQNKVFDIARVVANNKDYMDKQGCELEAYQIVDFLNKYISPQHHWPAHQ